MIFARSVPKKSEWLRFITELRDSGFTIEKPDTFTLTMVL